MTELEDELRTNIIDDIESFEHLMKNISEKHMKRKIRRKTKQGKTVEMEPIWMTTEIKKAISKRRYNKEKRKMQDNTEEYRTHETLYKEQRMIVKNMIMKKMS